MFKKEGIKQRIHFIGGTLFGVVLCMIITYAIPLVHATEIQRSAFGYSVYANGEMIMLNDAFIKDGKTYIQLREICNKVKVTVDWVDPKNHTLPIPGGNLPGGINLTNPTFVYANKVTNYYDTTQKIPCVEITGIYQNYKTGNHLKYAFGDEGLVVENDGIVKIIPLKYNPCDGRMYLSIEEFRDKVQPYLVDICMQVK